MTPQDFSQLSDQELLAMAKKDRSTAILNAFLIGFLIGIVIFSIAVNNFGFLMLIPLYLAYKLANNKSFDRRAFQAELKSRNLQ